MTAAPATHRTVWLLFVAGPVLWFAHFMAVYVFAESACAAGGIEADIGGIGVIELVTLAATVVAAGVTLALAIVAHRRWRAGEPATLLAGGERDGGLLLAGALLGYLSVIAILFTGVPAAFLDPC